LATAEDGRVRYRLKPGIEYQLFVSVPKDAGKRSNQKVSALITGEQRELVVELTTLPDVRFWGRIVTEGSTPVLDASVELTDGTRVLPDPDGFFELLVKSWVNVSGRASAPDCADVLFSIGPEHARRDEARLITIKRSAKLRVIVTDGYGEAVRVTCTTDGYQIVDSEGMFEMFFPPDPVWTESTAADGTCVLGGLPPGAPLTVSLSKGDRSKVVPGTIRLEPGELRELVIGLESGATIRGIVTDADGAPIPRQEVWLVYGQPTGLGFSPEESPAARVSTDADGQFEFNRIDPGDWSVGAAPATANWQSLENGESASLPESVKVLPGDQVREVNLVLHFGLYIEGIVLDPNGRGMRGTVYVTGFSEGGHVVTAETERGGRFSMGPLMPGVHELQASGAILTGYQDSERIPAHPGDDGLVLRLRLGATIRGVILDGVSGQPVKTDMTLSWPETADRPGSYQLRFGLEGEFEVQGLGANTYGLFATNGSGKAGFIQVRVADQTDVEGLVLTLVQAAKLTAFYEGVEGYAHIKISLGDIVVGGNSIQSGANASFTVPPGRLCVSISGLSEERVEFVDLEAGDEKDVRFTSN